MKHNEHYNLPKLVQFRDEQLDNVLKMARAENNHEAAGREYANWIIASLDAMLTLLPGEYESLSEFKRRQEMNDPKNPERRDFERLIRDIKSQIEKDPSIFRLAELLRREIPPQPWPQMGSEQRNEDLEMVKRASEANMTETDFKYLEALGAEDEERHQEVTALYETWRREGRTLTDAQARQIDAWKKYLEDKRKRDGTAADIGGSVQ